MFPERFASDEKKYNKAARQSNVKLDNLRELGESDIGSMSTAFVRDIMTPEEIAAHNVNTAIMLELVIARKERGVSQKDIAASILVEDTTKMLDVLPAGAKCLVYEYAKMLVFAQGSDFSSKRQIRRHLYISV